MGIEGRPLFSWRLHGKMLPSRSWRAFLLVTLTLLLFLPLYQLRSHASGGYYKQFIYKHLSPYLDKPGVYNNTLYSHGTEEAVHPHWNYSTPCSGFPSMDGVMLVMKTGATEAFDKVPTQLLTNLQCIKDFLLFSDLEQQIGKYHVYNVLDRVEDNIKLTHNEFKLYEAQQNCPVSQKDCTKDMEGGWDLDKYKFLNMVIRTWELRPGRDWYIFAEADTYVVWPTLIHWLQTKFDPSESLYIGSVAMLDNFPFAHGGSGYAVSGALIQKMVEEIPDLAAKYDTLAGPECCGDVLFAMAVDEVGTKVQQVHPMFNGEKPNTLPYGPGHWCEPIMTMHHMNSEEISAVWQYEQTRTRQEFMQIKDLYHAFFGPKMLPYRKEWDNLSDDTAYVGPDEESQEKADDKAKDRQKAEEDKTPVEKNAHNSPAACAKVCEAEGLDIPEDAFENLDTETARSQLIRSVYDMEIEKNPELNNDRKCFQWRYEKGVCWTSRSFKLGKPKPESKPADKMTSGWFVRGIEDWIESKGDCAVEWKEPR